MHKLKPARRRKSQPTAQAPRVICDAIYDRFQVAEILRTSARRIGEVTGSAPGQLPAYSVSRGKFLYLGADLLEWLRSQRISDAPQTGGESGPAQGTKNDETARDRRLDPGAARPQPDVGVARSGPTVIYGKCVRVGGEDKKTATLVLADGTPLTVRLSTKELAKQLGAILYKTIGLEGIAKWDIDKWKIQDFKATLLTDYVVDLDSPDATLEASLNRLANAFKGKWDEIDPDEYVRGLRSE